MHSFKLPLVAIIVGAILAVTASLLLTQYATKTISADYTTCTNPNQATETLQGLGVDPQTEPKIVKETCSKTMVHYTTTFNVLTQITQAVQADPNWTQNPTCALMIIGGKPATREGAPGTRCVVTVNLENDTTIDAEKVHDGVLIKVSTRSPSPVKS